MLHRLFQPKVLVFFVLGALIGGILFSLGNADDAPGLSLIGLTAAFLLMMRGIYHAKILRQGCHIPLVLMIYGVFGLTFPFVLFFDGEIRFFSPVTLISFAAGAAMLAIAVRRLRKKPKRLTMPQATQKAGIHTDTGFAVSQLKTAREAKLPGGCMNLLQSPASRNLALGELRCATCSLEAVLRSFLSRFSLVFRAFPDFSLFSYPMW